MSTVQKKMLSSKKKAAPLKAAPAVQKPLPDESSDSGSDSGADLQDDEEEFDDKEGSDSDEDSEEDDVTEEAIERMMQLLGDVDASELGLLPSADEEEGSGEEDEDEDGDEDEDEEMAEELYEDLEEEDGDVVPVERTTVNDKVALERVLASFKTDTSFFDTLSLTNPKELNIPDAENDLERELELCVSFAGFVNVYQR
jgi:rRNA-processing protein EBP2